MLRVTKMLAVVLGIALGASVLTATAASASEPEPEYEYRVTPEATSMITGVTVNVLIEVTRNGEPVSGYAGIYIDDKFRDADGLKDGRATIAVNRAEKSGRWIRPGVHTLRAAVFENFDDGGGVAPESDPVTITVHKRPTTTTLNVSPRTVALGEPIRLDAKLDGWHWREKESRIYAGGAALHTQWEKGARVVRTLKPGVHRLQARFSGSDWALPSSSKVAVVRVERGQPRLAVRASRPAWGERGQARATVCSPMSGFGVPTGAVTFVVGSAKVKAKAVSTSGKCRTYTAAFTGPRASSYAVTGAYAGDKTFAPAKAKASPRR